MSDLMLLGILRMPPETWGTDPLNVMQRYSAYKEAANRIENCIKDYIRLHDELMAYKYPGTVKPTPPVCQDCAESLFGQCDRHKLPYRLAP